MQFSLILTSLFCFTTWRNLVQASNVDVHGCPCTSVSEVKTQPSNIKNYSIQKDGICPFIAVAFRTVKGKTICSNPNDEWAKYVIQQLEKRRKEKISTRGTPPQSTRTSEPSTSTSPPWSGESEPTSDPTSAPSTSTSSTASPSTTLTPASTQSTPNPTSATTTSSNATCSTSAATTANNRIPATSMKTRKASTQRHKRTRKRPIRRNMKKWQRRCTSKSK